MKKTFQLVHPKIKYPRMIEAVKAEVRKYLKRNRRKTLPEGFDYWDFDCKYGDTEAEAKEIHLSEIDKHIDQAEKNELESFYIEIIGRAAKRLKK
ncbi:hypothetical protein LNTAR_14412 [Lentisphaera araneosa HTCC2155]|jgi:fructose-1,6-bisphosphatase|uniref:Uncharacterized protein n=1 Tax=Lentisphaera araneosa HTCC2155 TaxID=313628 RepID=A6DHD4_9BACT|nr:DUF6172 family protein [Lentisphaera araneosa]EDM29017.1 hypothetical protein LNTAR_14412 [Lentisphaera araneosa HTCC2155]